MVTKKTGSTSKRSSTTRKTTSVTPSAIATQVANKVEQKNNTFQVVVIALLFVITGLSLFSTIRGPQGSSNTKEQMVSAIEQVEAMKVGGEENFKLLKQIMSNKKQSEQYKQQFEQMLTQLKGSPTPSNNENNSNNNQATNTTPLLKKLSKLAIDMGVDEKKFTDCVDTDKYDDKIKAQMKQGATLFGVSGTPGSIILDKKTGKWESVAGAYPASKFEEVIHRLLNDNANFGKDKNGNKNTPLTADQIADITNGYLYGSDKTDIVIIEYSDIECPFCKRHHNNGTLKSVMAKFDGQISYMFKHFPLSFHASAQKGAEMIECVGEQLGADKFYKFIEDGYKG